MIASSEKSLVEDYLIKKLQEKGWKYIPGEELNRNSYEEPLLLENLINSIKRINYNVKLTSEDINWVINELRSKITGVESSKKILNYLKEGIPIKLKATNELKYIQLIDYNTKENNEFIVSNQVNFKGRETIRADIILFVNGIPLGIIECKDPTNPSESWEDAYRQIKNYEDIIPELFKYIQIEVAAEENVRYFPCISWEKDIKVEIWREEGKTEKDSIVEMLSPQTLLDLLKNFIFIRSEKSKVTRVIARYMQYRAANKIYERVINTIKGKENKKRGLIWHWQGSGKTLTMIFAAYKLYNSPLLENPTIFFIVDRIELQEQLFQEISALDIGIKPEKVESIEELKEMLIHDSGMGKRGFIVTLIHKFNRQKLQDLEQYLETELKEKESILTRQNVIAFVDESHRTQYGLLAAEMMNILRNAFFFGFTGTPIAKKGRNTFEAFSYKEDEEFYLDRYFVEDSIKDGFTIPIVYQPRLDLPELPKKDKQKLDELIQEFLEQEEIEDLDEIERITEKIKRKISKHRFEILMENPKLIDIIVKDIVSHFRNNLDGKFKAMIVTVSRRACVLYKRIIDKYLPPEYSEIVMTFQRTDPKEIQQYFIELKQKYKKDDDSEIRKEIIQNFKNSEYPKILIVTDMLLTGFDAPILQVMYLHKPLKGHKLLQAIARTNRPAKEKSVGIVVDYVGVLKDLNKALSFYSKVARKDIESGLSEAKNYESKFVEKIEKIKKMIGDVKPKFDDIEYIYKIITNLVLNAKEKEFVFEYRELRKLYELLGSSKVKLEYSDYFKFFTAIYEIYLKHRGEQEDKDIINRFYRSLVEEIHKSVEYESLEKAIPQLKVDESYINEIEKKFSSEEARVFNRLTVIRYVIKQKPRTPIYESISDKVEKLVKSWRERKIKIKELYEELKKAFGEIILADKEKQELGLDDIEYSLYKLLKEKYKEKDLIKKVKDLRKEIEAEIFPGWQTKKTIKSKMKGKIKLFLISLKMFNKTERDYVSERIIKIFEEY